MQLKDILANKQTIAILPHAFADGDAVGSSLGLARVLKKLGKKVDLRTSTPVNKMFDFVLRGDSYQELKNVEELSGYDLVIATDVAEPRLVFDFVEGDWEVLKDRLVVIDHHSTNQGWGRYNFVNPTMGANAQRTTHLILQNWGEDVIDEPVATPLLMGMYTDMGGFLWGVNDSTFEIASLLFKKGGDVEAIADNIFLNKYLKGWKFFGVVADRVKVGDGFLWSWFDDEDLQKFDLDYEEAEGYVAPLLKVKDKEFFVLFKKYGDLLKGSIRSWSGKAAWLAQQLGGGGHAKAAGFVIKLDSDTDRKKMMEEVVERIKELV